MIRKPLMLGMFGVVLSGCSAVQVYDNAADIRDKTNQEIEAAKQTISEKKKEAVPARPVEYTDVPWVSVTPVTKAQKALSFLDSGSSGGGIKSNTKYDHWALESGRPLHVQLKEWAERAGWHLEWSLKTSWIVPAPSVYSGSFEQAIESVIQDVYAQGKPIRLNVWEGNRLMEVVSHDVR